MRIPALRALSIKQCRRPSKRQMVLNTKWLSIFTTGFSISLSTTIRSSGLRQKALLRGGLGTCQAYESAYAKLLSAAGIENAETRDTYDGHTWNAVKLDDEWYQVDRTWDDTSDDFYGDLDQRHLYFCLTDELMAIAHPGHEKIYSVEGYATRSGSLKDNYFVRNGKADEWASAYADRIQQHLNAKETSFSIDADNQSFPPSISGIQNGIIAYKISLWEWKSNAIKAELSASSKVITSSSNKLNVKLNFEVTYQPKTGYEVFYHSAAASGVSPQSTPVAYGRPTPTLTASELGFSNGSAKFLGWRAYRDWDNTWWATMPDGRAGWVALEDGRLPGGCSYRLLPDGWETGWSAWSGTVHLYASWDEH